MSAPDPNVDRVRDLLRDKGYLASPLERYLIPGVSESTSFFAWDVRLAANVGLVAGALFAILLGLATLATNPELAGRPLDLLIYMAYLVPVTGLPIAALDALLGLALRSMPGALRSHPERTARITATILGGALLGFLALFLLSEPLPRGGGPLRGAAKVVLLATLAVLVARLAALSVMGFAVRLGAVPRPAGSGAGRRVATILIPAVALGAAWIASGAWDGSRTTPRAPSTFSLQPPGHELTLLAIDGVSWDDAHSLAPFSDLLARGYAAPLLAPAGGWDNPAALWTTIATGQPPEKHGILSLGTQRVPGMSAGVRESLHGFPAVVARALQLLRIARPSPITDTARTVKAAWEIFADKSQPAIVVNFWGTSPAQDLPRGAVCSETAFFALRRGARIGSEVAPVWVAPIADAAFQALPSGCDPASIECFAERSDAFHASLVPAIAAHDPELARATALVYLPGRDIVRFQLARGDVAAGALAAFDAGIAQRIAPVIARGGTLLIVASPGRSARSATRGMLLLLGTSIRPGTRGEPADLLDVAPTFLYLAGFPSSEDLPGRVLADAADDAFRALYPVRKIETFGDRRVIGKQVRDDRDLYEDLRSLGYVK
ncbi:MAG: hypothetical protein U0166_27400 [Acidobacteriota bacterium]